MVHVVVAARLGTRLLDDRLSAFTIGELCGVVLHINHKYLEYILLQVRSSSRLDRQVSQKGKLRKFYLA